MRLKWVGQVPAASSGSYGDFQDRMLIYGLIGVALLGGFVYLGMRASKNAVDSLK